MSTLSPDQWSALSPYLDKALTLSEAERAHWLKEVGAENPDLARQLQELLSEHEAAQQEAFLETSPIALPESPGLAGQTLGTYRLVSPIGHGGMGTVWLAERSDGRFERKAAVKFLSAALVGRGGEERAARRAARRRRSTSFRSLAACTRKVSSRPSECALSRAFEVISPSRPIARNSTSKRRWLSSADESLNR